MPVTTIKDIARLLGISPSTVSRALRGHPDISPKTKQRVMKMAQRLQYHPNQIAQSLQNQRSNTIGIIVPEIKHSFFASVIGGVEDVAYKSGYTIMVCASNEEYEREAINTRAMLSHRVAGLLISLSSKTKKLEHLKMVLARGIPLVFFDRAAQGLPASQVTADDFEGAYGAVSHLIAAGHTRIAHLAGPQNISISRYRYQGYRKALDDHGLPFDKTLVVRGGYSNEDGYRGMKELWRLTPRPRALFAVNDPVAIGVYQYAKEEGIRIPRDMAIVGFSNETVSALLDPPLTTVEQPAYEMGQSAAGLLLQQINADMNGGFVPEIKRLKTRLIVRASV